MSLTDFDRDVERAVDMVLQRALRKLDALKETIDPTPPPQMTVDELWAALAAQNRQTMKNIGAAIRRVGIALTIELFGTAQQKQVSRQLMDGTSR
jgi:hypothetical protein